MISNFVPATSTAQRWGAVGVKIKACHKRVLPVSGVSKQSLHCFYKSFFCVWFGRCLHTPVAAAFSFGVIFCTAAVREWLINWTTVESQLPACVPDMPLPFCWCLSCQHGHRRSVCCTNLSRCKVGMQSFHRQKELCVPFLTCACSSCACLHRRTHFFCEKLNDALG